MSSRIVDYAIKAFIDEVETREVYYKLSRIHVESEVSSKLKRIAEIEDKHADFWKKFLEMRGVDTSKYKASTFKVNLLALTSKVLGAGLTLKLLESGERNAIELYSKMLEMPGVNSREKVEIKKVLEDELVHEQEFEESEEKFREFVEHVRDAVLGMNDGIVEVLSVSAGLAGVYGEPLPVAIGGLIVGIAGAISMGVGVYTSVKTQGQVRLSILDRVRLASKHVSYLFKSRIEKYMVEKGFSPRLSREVAKEAVVKPEVTSRIIAEEEYGLKEESIEDPTKASIYTGLSYILGAILTLTPYLAGLPTITSMPLSLIVASSVLALTGVFIAVLGGLNLKRKVFELIIGGLGSALVTFSIGRIASSILGVEVS